jgi:hypothetical protein
METSVATLSFDDLLAEAHEEAEAKGLEFVAKAGVKVVLRPVLMLADKEMKLVLTLAESMQDDKLSIDAKLEAVSQILVAAADKKDAMKKSLAELPLAQRVKIFETWMKAADLPEA